jgi:hypothetical protein
LEEEEARRGGPNRSWADPDITVHSIHVHALRLEEEKPSRDELLDRLLSDGTRSDPPLSAMAAVIIASFTQTFMIDDNDDVIVSFSVL